MEAAGACGCRHPFVRARAGRECGESTGSARLDSNPRLQALAANPLLLSLIVTVYERQLDLPERWADLYKRCVDTLLSEWDASRDIRRREFKPDHKLQLLEEVAWHFHRRGRRHFPDGELLDVIAGFLPAIGLPRGQNHHILEEIAAENGLLKQQAHGWHGFLHLTLQDYGCVASTGRRSAGMPRCTPRGGQRSSSVRTRPWGRPRPIRSSGGWRGVRGR
jgi:predicted NACHT family NTPase